MRKLILLLGLVLQVIIVDAQSVSGSLVDEKGNPFDYPYFIHDSYDFSDAINHFDCTKATDTKSFPENTKTRAFAKGLIALRKTTDAFNFKSKADVDARVTLLTVPGTNNVTQEDLVLRY